MVYFSTGGYKDQTAIKTCNQLLNNKIYNIELFGGRYDKNLYNSLLELRGKANFRLHNYFPPPKIPFVFNLASLDENISTLFTKKSTIQWIY